MEHDSNSLSTTAIVWFRNDLRTQDNAALVAASRHAAVIPVFIREAGSPARSLGAARRWWLHHSLSRLTEKLEHLGAPLHLVSGDPVDIIPELVKATGASAVYWNRRYDPAHQNADSALKIHLHNNGIETESFSGQLLHEPTRLRTGAGTYYKVYSPFWRALESDLENSPPMPLPAPQSLTASNGGAKLESESLDDWQLLPTKPDWSGGIADVWTPGEDGAHDRLTEFLENRLRGYAERRDIPGVAATSGLSAHLASGEITPAQIFQALSQTDNDASNEDRSRFRKEIAWREFSWHLLVNNPGLPVSNHNPKFDAFPWVTNADSLSAWQKGLTGYPVVDAGMRQLWQTGWMHNRVRMIVASFLIKHLMIDWREGEAWFWDTLVDADPASNAASWQWVAGSGADASPYYRIFNPILQGDKFDTEGAYVREFVPELAELPDKFIHKPWTAPEDVLLADGIRLGETYPHPIVDHQAARQRALASYQSIKDAA
ncbi:deoxyribodipyrimidine photo-lyase type I [Hoeflea sp. IMCC20628]|uniref:cryptochrome/photolyase family protein n=1 Tax=Hoeflea sp. IMCC20628 TaxID=1620421 RepID=UPI00063AC3CE|nr:deoxyribodipyrimidine photo-lyase [Hoeflea sp. IMCC20628]AKI00463.1 deoxyribodipyrimidine photo-lyase type I [Hoeflea sp. IMCC20628]